jgi:spore germination cell wall hydrolase CwlJ-like protein
MNFVSHQVKGGLMEKTIRALALAVGLLFAVVILQHITSNKFQALKMSAGVSFPDVVTIKTREKELECLALNIYREAGYEPFEGKVAVAQVTLNRVAHPAFPKDVCGVVYQKTTTIRTICQFSWYCDSTHRNRPINSEAYKESYAVAKKVLLENFKLDVLKTALYYHADYVNPQWKLEKIGKIGTHIFYNEKPRTIERIYAKF